MTSNVLNAVVTQRIEVAPGLFILQVVPDGWPLPPFRPGQFAVLGLPPEAPRHPLADPTDDPPPKPGALIRRSYSIASSSADQQYLEFYLNLVRSGSLTPRLDYTWQSKFETTIPNNIPNFEFGRVESRGLLNARLTYRTPDDAWEAALAATNLTDEFYFVNKYDRFAQSGNAYGQPGRPREIIFSVKRKF